jgi:DNA polymerase-3 subunit delta
MSDPIAAIQFLSDTKPPSVPAVCVLFGDEPLLRSETLSRLRAAVLSGEDGDLSLTVFDGNKVELREVFDELAMVSMFGGGQRMVIVNEADKFVTKYRAGLENYCQQPRLSSVLVLAAESWPANTRLYKKLTESGLQINCNLPKNRFGEVDQGIVLKWLRSRAEKHQALLSEDAAEVLFEIVGPQLGRLDQELAKLSLLTDFGTSNGTESSRGNRRIISRELIEQTVGGWRAKTAWAMIEAALDGNAAVALVELDRLLLAGEEPIALLAMMSGSLRRMAAAARIVEQAEHQRRRIGLQEALREAGVTPKKFVLEKTERQLRQITRPRAKHIFGWLLEADLALKGASSSGDRARLVLEKLIVRLSRQMAPKVPAN